jgi:hypothetical protein
MKEGFLPIISSFSRQAAGNYYPLPGRQLPERVWLAATHLVLRRLLQPVPSAAQTVPPCGPSVSQQETLADDSGLVASRMP